MESYLLDTNIILRITDNQSNQHQQAANAVSTLLNQGNSCYLTPQVLQEFVSVLTRPLSANGFGWNLRRSIREVDLYLERFYLLDDIPEIFPKWRTLLLNYPAGGRRVFDHRLVAVVQAHGTNQILTFDIGDFPKVPGISIVHPHQVVS